MAEWRERGYVPDSDDEDEDSYSRPNQELEKQTKGPYSPDGQYGLDWPRVQQEISSSLSRTHNASQGSSEATPALSLNGHVPTLPQLPLIEEEVQPINHIDSVRAAGHLSSSPVVEQLQATLSLGLKQIGELLRNPPSPRESIQNGSLSSSPLSSLGSLEHELGKSARVEELPPRLLQSGSNEPSHEHVSQPSPEYSGPQRALRQRTQIQLHPYALEDARYQQELRARGLRPVRISAVPGQSSWNPAQSAGDEASLFSSSPAQEDSLPVPRTHRTQDETFIDLSFMHSDAFAHSTSPPRMGDDEEDLPDLATILKANLTSTKPPHSNKPSEPQKHPSGSNEQLEELNIFDLLEDEDTTFNRSSERATFFVPPSPPHSSSASASNRVDGTRCEKQQQEATPGRLPTPLVSSEIQSRKRAVVELSDSSQDTSDGGADVISMLSPENDNEKSGKIRAMKRKIKGVLPASWLKLDLKEQTVIGDPHKGLRPAREHNNGRGIAKPLSTPRARITEALPSSNLRNNAFDLDFSDQSISSDEEMNQDHDDYRRPDTKVLSTESSHVLEDNRIDTMQPARQRYLKAAVKPQRKRQQRISGGWQGVSEQSKQSITPRRSDGTSKPRPHNAPRAKRQRKYRSSPRLSVLDAPGFVQSSIVERPRFLRIASRRAQKEPRNATQYPRKKFLRLATDMETGDINQGLKDWRGGRASTRHNYQATASDIGPVADGSPLPQTTISTLSPTELGDFLSGISSPADGLAVLKDATDATVQRILFRQQGLPASSQRKAASTISTSQPASLARMRTDINFRKPLRNRAGLGLLQKAPARPRIAQLENTMPTRRYTMLSHPLATSNANGDHTLSLLSTARMLTAVKGHDEQLAATDLQLTLQTEKNPVVQRTRKGRAPRRTQLMVPTEACHLSPTVGLSVASAPSKVAEEANIVVNIMATLSLATDRSVTNDGWSILWPPLQTWLEEYVDQQSNRTQSEKRQAQEIFRGCRNLILEHRWPAAWDDLVRKAAWFFATFGMIDPFDSRTDPHLGFPPFLEEMHLTNSLSLSGAADSTFHIFLNMLAIALTERSTNVINTTGGLAMDKKRKTELQSFVNRLYPNNGRLLSEHEEVPKIHLASLWNRCSLYLTLYCYTIENCRPRLSQLQGLVDLSQSHIKACEVMLAVWSVLARFHAKSPEASQYNRLTDISEWMQSILFQMLLKRKNARLQVERQLGGRTMDVHADYVVNANQSSVDSFVQRALDMWTTAIKYCGNQTIADQILGGGQQLELLLSDLAATYIDNDTMLQHVLGVIDSYLHKYNTSDLPLSSSSHTVVHIIFRAIDSLLSRRVGSEALNEESGLTRVLNRRLVYDWYLVASVLVTAKEKSWDEFLEPVGKYSWERFNDAKRSAQYKTLFLSHIINISEDAYRDNKFWYLSYWLKVLLRPVSEWAFEHELSRALLTADQYEPMLMNLPFLLQSGEDGYDLTFADLQHNRTTVLERIIEGIGTASTTYDSQMVDPYALQPAEMEDLLRLMMNTMRSTQSSLDNHSRQRDEYEVMVCKLAETMDRYTSSLVPLDSWLRDAETIALSKYNLKKRFGGPLPATCTVTVPKQDVMWFQHTCQKAALQGTQDQICEILHSVYVDASEVSETEWYQPKLLAMMQQVFPAYLEVALTDKGAVIAAPILRTLDLICNNIFMRAVNIEANDYSELLDALYTVIISARIAMQRSNMDRAVTSALTFERGTFEEVQALAPELSATQNLTLFHVMRIARIGVLQYREIVRCVGLPQIEVLKIAGHARYIFMFVRALWLCLYDGQNSHWPALEKVGCQHLSDLEANKIKQFAAEELEKSLRSDWSADPDGNWWIMQGRSAVQVKAEPTAELTDARLRRLLKDEMQAYMQMYEAITGRTETEAFTGYGLEPNLKGI